MFLVDAAKSCGGQTVIRTRRILLAKADKPAGGTEQLSLSEPVGICYIASTLRQHGFDCRLSHFLMSDGFEPLREAIVDFHPDVVGFSVRLFNFQATASLARTLRREFRGIAVVLGGECFTEENALTLASSAGADAVFLGDAEDTLLDYVSGVPPSRIPGVAFKNGDGAYVLSSSTWPTVDVRRLPQMVRDGLPQTRYSSSSYPGAKYATIHAQRGCRFQCSFCQTPHRRGRTVSRSVNQILDEIDHLVGTYGIEALSIWDEDFFADTKRVKGLVDGLLRRGSPLRWQSFMAMSDLASPAVAAMLPSLRESGYTNAFVGLETFCERTLRRYNKAVFRDAERLLFRLADNDITLGPMYIIGASDETYSDMRSGLERLLHLRSVGVRMISPYVSFLVPWPGTPVYQQCAGAGLIVDHDWSHYDGSHVVVRCKNCEADRLVELREWFYDEFYGRANRVPARQSVRPSSAHVDGAAGLCSTYRLPFAG